MSDKTYPLKPKRADARTGKHRAKNPEDLKTPEERAEINRENGRKNTGENQRGISNMERRAVEEVKKAMISGEIPCSDQERTRLVQEERKRQRDQERHGMYERAKQAAITLGQGGFRIRGDIRTGEMREAAKTIGEVSLQQMMRAVTGGLSKDKINAILKASIAAREEVCDPLVKEQKITGALTLEQLVSQAAQKAKERK